MYRELIINATEHETRVALLEDGTIAELFIERNDDRNIAGNIYKGRVQRVLPGMQAAFVDIGLKQAAFLYVDDVAHDDDGAEIKNRFREGDGEEPLPEEGGAEEEPVETSGLYHIEDLLEEGRQILVQVAKSPIGGKGARVTTNVSIPGRYLVLMPTVNHIGVSRRIEDEEERGRLKALVEGRRSDPPYGYIVRTAAEKIDDEKIEKEMLFLSNLWKSIQKKDQILSAPVLLYNELTLTLRAVRDLLTHEADKVVVDDRGVYEEVLLFLKEFMPGLLNSVEYYDDPEPIFDFYNLEGDVSRALKKKVWLKSGGYIIIEQTEALVAIDVNTGRYVGKHNFEETIVKTNLEAVKEIAYQIRLRNLGGIIIIDFIDMERKSNREKVYNAFKEALKRDKSKTHVLPLSELGLIQMTRKRIRKSLNKILCEPCVYCEGNGYMSSRQTICYNIYRDLIREAQDMAGSRLTLRVNPEIAELLHGEERHVIASCERRTGKQIVIYPNPRFLLEEFDVFEIIKD